MDFKNIDTEELNRMLIDQIHELERMGLVDHNFGYCQTLKDVSGALFFLELILIFLEETLVVVEKMTAALQPSEVDFSELRGHYVKLKGSSSCIGAIRISDACSSLNKAIDKKSRDGSQHALDCIDHEYNVFKERLANVIKIEQEIVNRSTL